MEKQQTPAYILGNRYQIQQTLGTGGMSVVYLAKDLMLERPVALKVLRPDLSSDSDFGVKFKLEAKAAAILSHPNIVTVHDFGSDHGRLFIVMEYVPGQDLKTIIKQMGRYDVKEALSLMIQACSGLGYAHRAGLVHCDVKPHNMIVTPEDRLKITDFGISRALSSINPNEHSDIVWGSPQYFSPEQACGMAPSPASDVYSLGVILYEMLTGQLPFVSNDTAELIRLHREISPIPPKTYNPLIPEELNRIIVKVLSKEPSSRYRTADQLGRILSAYLDQLNSPISQQTISVRPSLPVSSPAVVKPSVAPARPSKLPTNPGSNTKPIKITNANSDPIDFWSEFRKMDWATIGLGLLTLLVFGGLIPYWMYIWLTLMSR